MIRQEQCDKVCRILDDVLANRPTERDSLIVAVRKAFDALEQAETNCSEIPNNCPATTAPPQMLFRWYAVMIACITVQGDGASCTAVYSMIMHFAVTAKGR